MSSPSDPRVVVILSSIRWGFTWQRHQAIARAAAQAGWTVIFRESHPRRPGQIALWVQRKIRGKLGLKVDNHETSPHAIPEGAHVISAEEAPTVRSFCRRVDRITGGRPVDLVVAYLPSGQSWRIIERLGAPALSYDDVLDWAEVPADWFPPPHYDLYQERFLAPKPGRISRLTSDSAVLLDIWRERGHDGVLIPPAADDEYLDVDWGADAIVPRRIGYFGAVLHTMVDVDLLVKLAERYEVVVAGPADEVAYGKLRKAGASIIGPFELPELVENLRTWSAILLPYQTNRANTLVPAKIWNAIATGRPVYTSGLMLGEELVPFTRDMTELFEDGYEIPAPQPRDNVPVWGDRWATLIGAFGDSLAGAADETVPATALADEPPVDHSEDTLPRGALWTTVPRSAASPVTADILDAVSPVSNTAGAAVSETTGGR
ncbi:MAG: hypothetical protein LBM23_01185 [Propionibacteriaceae bacterium]|jgi:hypothetical protein|nr:hypothetical protein [Propionibacteriaceae bacterium]